MFYIEVHNIINKIISLYHLLGIWKHEENTIYHEGGRKLFHLIFNVSFMVSLMSGAFQSNDFDESIFLSASALAIAVITIKLFYILWKKKEILSFLRSTAVHCIADRAEFVQLNKKCKAFMNLVAFFCGMLFVLNVSFATVPIFSIEKKLPVNIGFPFDWKNNEIAYWTAYAYLMFVIAFHSAHMLITVLIWYIMFNCALKYQILEMQFKNIGTSRPSTATQTTTVIGLSKGEKQNLYLQELIELMNIHQQIQETIKQFKSCFDKLFFAQISTSGICICGSIYVLAFSSHANSIQTIIYAIFMLYNFYDIFMVMYLGNEISLFSGRLSYGLFQSDWINQSKTSKKCIVTLMEVLKKPQELVVGFVYPLSLATFTSVLKFAYSSLNILLNDK